MKKLFVLTVTILGSLQTVHAQEATRVATLHSGGKVTVQTLPAEEPNRTAVSSEPKPAPATVQQAAFVSHEAVLLRDGTQEIRVTDASGKVTVISAAKGESVQAKYIDYLAKNHLPCACGAPASAEQPAQTATRPSPAEPDQMKK